MAALTDRQGARERMRQVFEAQLDRLIPADLTKPLEAPHNEWAHRRRVMGRSIRGVCWPRTSATSSVTPRT